MFDPASIGAALGSAKTILDLLKNANDSQLALKISTEIANLQGRLIDVQQQAISLQGDSQLLNDEIRELKKKLAETVSAPPCPSCLKRGFRVESSRPDPVMGDVGLFRRKYKCEHCGFTEDRQEK